MNAYTPFTATRKTMIVNMKAMLTSSDFKPYKDPKYGTKYPRLYLEDYAVYAVLRGADFRKTSHLREQGAPNARAALDSVLVSLEFTAKRPEGFGTQTHISNKFKRYVLGAHGEFKAENTQLYQESVNELIELIRLALKG